VAIYGDAPEPRHEDTPPRPNTPYGESKLSGETVFRAWTTRGEGRRCLVIRPTVTFGRHNFANMYTLIDQIYRGRFVIVGKGTNIKSLSYVENAVEATMFLMDRSDPPPFDAFNYITKPDLTSMEIVTEVYRALGKRMPRLRFPWWLARLGAVPFDAIIALTGKNLPISSARLKKVFASRTVFEADKLRRAGYQSRVSLPEGIEAMVSWYLEEGKDRECVWHLPPPEIVRISEDRR
jgi:nucleoside-diphosphate-sugar epimerase